MRMATWKMHLAGSLTRMRMSKGISEVVSWVLLISMTVVLAIIVASWMTQHTRDVISSEVENTGYLCDDVAFNVRKADPLVDCSDQSFAFIIKNTGSFTIDEFVIRADGVLARNGLNINPPAMTVIPGTSEEFVAKDFYINGLASTSKVEFIPVMDGKSCGNRRTVFQC